MDCRFCLDKQVDAHADPNPEHVGIGDFQSPPRISAQVEKVNRIEILGEVFSHPVKRDTVKKAVVCDERDHPFIPNPIRPPPNRLHIQVVELIFERCFGVFCIRLCNPRI